MRLPRKPPIAAPITVPASRLPALPPIALPIRPPATAPAAVPPTSFGPEFAAHAATLRPINAQRDPPVSSACRLQLYPRGRTAVQCRRLRPNGRNGAKLCRARAGGTGVVWLSSPCHLTRLSASPATRSSSRHGRQGRNMHDRHRRRGGTDTDRRADLALALSSRWRLLRARLPDAYRQDHRAVSRRRHRRRDAAHHRRLAVAQVGPVGNHREPDRRRRQYRRRSGRQIRSRRLHPAVVAAAAFGHQPEPLSASRLRSAAIRADRGHRPRAERAGRQPGQDRSQTT